MCGSSFFFFLPLSGSSFSFLQKLPAPPLKSNGASLIVGGLHIAGQGDGTLGGNPYRFQLMFLKVTMSYYVALACGIRYLNT